MSPLIQNRDQAPVLTWLHVSDIHFGHGQEARHRVDQKITCDEILRDAECMATHLGPPDLVFITGDVAFKGDPQKEYPQASEWLEKLLAAVQVTKEKLYVVPGNHDVDRGEALKGFTRKCVHKCLREIPKDLDELLENPVDMATIWPKLEAYAEFAEPYGAPRLTPEAPFWGVKRDTPLGQIVIVGLNTNLLSFNKEDSHRNLALGAGQLKRAIHDQPRDALLMVLQHHPPDWLVDGDELERMLQDRPHILFCGHVHKQGGFLVAPLHGHGLIRLVAGAGHTDPPYPAEHAYAWGQLRSEGLAYFPRTWSGQQHRFVADQNNFRGMGQDGAVRITRSQLPEELRGRLPIWSEITLDMTSDTNRAVLLKDKVYLLGEGYVNLSFPALISTTGPTPGLKLSLFGFTISRRKVIPSEAKCTVVFPDGRESPYDKLENNDFLFKLPRAEEAVSIRVSLSFKRRDIKVIKALIVDENGREFSKVLEE